MKPMGWLSGTAWATILVSTSAGWAQEASAVPSPPAAGTAAAAPPAAGMTPAASALAVTAAAPAGPGGFTLHLRTNQPGVAFHYAKVSRDDDAIGTRSWVRACLEECELTLSPGSYRFALSSGASDPIATPKRLELSRDTRIEGAYTERSARRSAGWIVLGLGGGISAANIALGAGLSANRQKDIGNPTLIAGFVGLAISMLVGIPLAFTSDDAQVDLAR